ncbi:Platinum sensitivity protein [Coemansia sp. RSA 1358]|uniref:Platinum sensitivity protein n=1 Tax=Coemansia umbellata TaxID=1424467 RepID=A0ABQ8PHV7_9FUNG|nr:Platinum sensitivity protein [Coemansia umbellata]KAJ2620268.1 Platinum sensitivity protein [Coemansia sp. RSA 1358]
MTSADSQVRVKVYQLEEGSNWLDKGTGFCTLEDCQGVLHLNVVSEHELNRVILDCVVQRGEVYQQQDSTLIVWTEPTGEDIALSFQEQEGCLSILNQILEFENVMKEQQQQELGNENELEWELSPNEVTLPHPSLGTLKDIDQIISGAGKSLFQRDKVVSFIVDGDYFSHLTELHEMCEDLDSMEALHAIYNIVKHIILLNASAIFEYITRDENILGVVGMLEHNPDHPVARGTYRDFLRDNSRYKQVVPISDPSMEAKVHQTFRLQYLKDVVLQRILDDGTLPIINALIFFNHAQIANYIQGNHEFLQDLFGILQDSADNSKKRDVVFFIRQLSTLAKNLPGTYRVGLCRALSHHGLFTMLEYAFQAKGDGELQAAGAEVFLAVLEHDRALVRTHLFDQARFHHERAISLFQLVIAAAKNRVGTNAQALCCEIVRVLLETGPSSIDMLDQQAEIITATSQNDRGAEDFLSLFYDSYVNSLMSPLLELTPQVVEELNAEKKDTSLLLFVCETLSMMIRLHGYRARSFVFTSNISKSVCVLLSAKAGHLKLAALRFIRTCIGMHDEAYNKYLIANHLLDPIASLYVKVRARDNLVTSACRELFNFVAVCRVPSLLAHILSTLSKTLKKVPNTLEQLQQAYNRYLEDMERARNGASADGLATPTVDTGRRSAVSISMLVEKDSGSGDLFNVHSGDSSNGGGPWGASVADELENAYLESSNDGNELEDASSESPLAILDDRGTSDKMDDMIQSPELDGLQDCLEIYSDTENKASIQSSNPTSKIGVLSKRPVRETNASTTLPMYHSNNTKNDKPDNYLLSGLKSMPDSPLPFKTSNSVSGFPWKSANANDSEFSGNFVNVQAQSGATCSPPPALGNGSRHAKLSDAFPDSRPINRRPLTKRSIVGRVNSRSQIKINVPLTGKPQSDDTAQSNEPLKPNGRTLDQPPLLKRQRSSNGTRTITDIATNCAAHSFQQYKTEKDAQAGVSSGKVMSNGSDNKSSHQNAHESDAANARCGTAFPRISTQRSSSVAFATNNSTERQTPPKKAKTASF